MKLRSYEMLNVADEDAIVSHRLLTALVMGWDLVPMTTQIRLVQDTCLIDAEGDLSAPDEVLGFITRQKNRPLPS